MKKIINNIITVSQVCLSAIFVIMLLLTILGVMPVNAVNGKVVCDSYLEVLLILLSIIYVALSTYMVINAIHNANKIKYVKINQNTNSTAMVNAHVIKKIAITNSKLVGKIKINKISIYGNDKEENKLIVYISAQTENLSNTTEKLKLVLDDCYTKILGIKFTEINIKVKKLKTDYVPDMNEIETMLNNEKETKIENNNTEVLTLNNEQENNKVVEEKIIEEEKPLVKETIKEEPKIVEDVIVSNIEDEEDEIEEIENIEEDILDEEEILNIDSLDESLVSSLDEALNDEEKENK